MKQDRKEVSVANLKPSTEKVWEDFSSSLRVFIARRVLNRSHVEDILQDIFVKIHKNISSIEDETKLRSWVYQIARNTIIDHYRKNKIKTEELTADHFQELIEKEQFSENQTENPLENLSENPNQEIASGLRDMIEQLPEKYAHALLMVEFEGLTQTELAERLGISVSGAKSRVQRGRQMLRDILMRCCHFEFDRFGTIIDYYPHCCCCESNCS
jgi:RNA polymerase sigma-70 factor (ECF subfamily)